METQQIEAKMGDVLHEIKFLVRNNKDVKSVQRYFGILLGLRMALHEVNKLNGVDPYSGKYERVIATMIDDGFADFSKEKLRDYAFPAYCDDCGSMDWLKYHNAGCKFKEGKRV